MEIFFTLEESACDFSADSDILQEEIKKKSAHEKLEPFNCIIAPSIPVRTRISNME